MASKVVSIPAIFATDESNVIILSQDHVYIDVKKSEAERIVEQMPASLEALNDLKESKAIAISSITKVSSDKNDKDVEISFQIGGDSKEETIDLVDAETRDRFIETIYKSMGKEYRYSVKEYTRLKASFGPLIGLVVILILGGALTWFAQAAQTGPKRDMIVKGFVYIIYQIAKFIGPTGAMVITGVLALICILVLVQRVKTPPIMMTIEKKS